YLRAGADGPRPATGRRGAGRRPPCVAYQTAVEALLGHRPPRRPDRRRRHRGTHRGRSRAHGGTVRAAALGPHRHDHVGRLHRPAAVPAARTPAGGGGGLGAVAAARRALGGHAVVARRSRLSRDGARPGAAARTDAPDAGPPSTPLTWAPASE